MMIVGNENYKDILKTIQVQSYLFQPGKIYNDFMPDHSKRQNIEHVLKDIIK